VRRADNLTIFMCRLKSRSLNFLEPSGPVQACNEIAVPFTVRLITTISSLLTVFHPAKVTACLFSLFSDTFRKSGWEGYIEIGLKEMESKTVD
jgi:hypothetical protein